MSSNDGISRITGGQATISWVFSWYFYFFFLALLFCVLLFHCSVYVPSRESSLFLLILGLCSWSCFLISPLFNFLLPFCCVDIG